MDNSISDENKTTVAAAAVVAASTITAVAGTSTITKTPDDDSQCVNNDNNDVNDYADQESVNSDNNDDSNNHYDKISSATSIYPNQVNSTTDQTIPFTDGQINCHSNISRTKDLVHKCQSDPGGRTTMRSQLNRSPRYPAASGASNMTTTTRKCVLTLDGYNYVIGKLFYANKQTEQIRTKNGSTKQRHTNKDFHILNS